MRVVLLGTYDLGKPRTRLLREALRAIDPELVELHFPVWEGVEDKSVMTGLGTKLGVALRLLLAYPVLAVRYLFAGRHDVVVIGYLGLFDMLLLAPLAKLRGKPVVWDAFLSVYDTYARDRAMASEIGWRAKMLRWMERTACRLADRVVLDTQAHAALKGELHGVSAGKLDAVFVGAEAGHFRPSGQAQEEGDGSIRVLFYGQFIPLHGIDTIVEAALDPRGYRFAWTIIGQGQEAGRIDARLAKADAPHVERVAWVDYDALQDQLARADVCLGIFGNSDKAARVIPNKVYQTLLADRPLITRDSPAMRELVSGARKGFYMVPPADPQALLDALELFEKDRAGLPATLHGDLCEKFSMSALTQQWHGVLERALAR